MRHKLTTAKTLCMYNQFFIILCNLAEIDYQASVVYQFNVYNLLRMVRGLKFRVK